MTKYQKKTGLLFGSFNPIHNGHLILASFMLEFTDLNEVWFVVSPHNPHKSARSMIHEFDRIDMVELAIEDNDRFKASDIEFQMSRPSFTINTLTHLCEKHPAHQFKLIIGEDNLKSFPRWKNNKVILEDFGLLVYPRPGARNPALKNHPNVLYIEAPLLDISATYIRKAIHNGLSIKYLVPEKIADFIQERQLYS